MEEQLNCRRGTAAAIVVFSLVEYGHGINLPDQIYANLSVQKLKELANDIIVLQNEIISHVKEQMDGVNNNIISICRTRGMTAQEALDHINERLRNCYREWYMTQACLPVVSESVDSRAKVYRGTCQLCFGNTAWEVSVLHSLTPMKKIPQLI